MHGINWRGWIALTLAATAPVLEARATDLPGCLGEAPLVDQGWIGLPDSNVSFQVGKWALPVSSAKPDLITAAALAFDLAPMPAAEGLVEARFEFTFNDPKPFGLPFSFQKLALEWEGPEGTRVELLDWAGECQGPGRSIFPGQGFTTSVRVPRDALARPMRLLVWGSRM